MAIDDIAIASHVSLDQCIRKYLSLSLNCKLAPVTYGLKGKE